MDRREAGGHVSGPVVSPRWARRGASVILRRRLKFRRDVIRAFVDPWLRVFLFLLFVGIIVVVFFLFRVVVGLRHVAVEELLHLSLGHVRQALHEICIWLSCKHHRRG